MENEKKWSNNKKIQSFSHATSRHCLIKVFHEQIHGILWLHNLFRNSGLKLYPLLLYHLLLLLNDLTHIKQFIFSLLLCLKHSFFLQFLHKALVLDLIILVDLLCLLQTFQRLFVLDVHLFRVKFDLFLYFNCLFGNAVLQVTQVGF